MNYKQSEKFLKRHKDIIYKYLGKENCGSFIDKTLEYYKETAPTGYKYKKSFNRAGYTYAIISLSTYKVLQDIGYDKKTNLDKFNKMWIDIGKRSMGNSAMIKLFYSGMSKNKFLKDFKVKGLTRLNEPHGWKAELVKNDAYMSYNIRQCGMFNWFSEQGYPELCKTFCEFDYITAEYMTGLTFKREKTLANGDEMCDFRYYKK